MHFVVVDMAVVEASHRVVHSAGPDLLAAIHKRLLILGLIRICNGFLLLTHVTVLSVLDILVMHGERLDHVPIRRVHLISCGAPRLSFLSGHCCPIDIVYSRRCS